MLHKGIETAYQQNATNALQQQDVKNLSEFTNQNDNLDILPVWDVIIGKWRSFHISNIISVDIMKKKN